MKPAEIGLSEWIRYNLYFILEHFTGYDFIRRNFETRRRKLFSEILQRPEVQQRARLADVRQMKAEDIRPALKNQRELFREPVVFRGAASDWDCCRKWSLDFFAKEFGELDVFILDTPGAVDRENPQDFEKLLLRDFVEQMKAGTLKYLKFSNIVQEKMKLQNDLNLAWLKKFEWFPAFGTRFYMFMGGAGTVTPLHNEFPAVVYVQVSGRKKWIIYTAEERIFLDPRTERRIYFYTEADPRRPDDPRFPLFPYARRYEIILEPGDVLWFPPFAWHYVENLETSIAVAYKFNDLIEGFRTSPVLNSLYLMATRPNLLINFLSSRFSKNYVDTTSAKSR